MEHSVHLSWLPSVHPFPHMMRPHSPRAATAAQLLLFALLSGAALTPGGGAALNQAPPGPPPPQQHQQHQQLTPRRPSSQQRAGAAATGPPAGRALAQQRQDGPSSEQQAEPPRPRPPRARRRHRRKLAFDYFLHQARLEVPESEEAEGCDARVGAGYVERWRRLGGVFCAPPGGPPPPAPDARRAPPPPPLPPPPEAGSSVRCNAHPAADLTACFVSNMGFDRWGGRGRLRARKAVAPCAPRLHGTMPQPMRPSPCASKSPCMAKPLCSRTRRFQTLTPPNTHTCTPTAPDPEPGPPAPPSWAPASAPTSCRPPPPAACASAATSRSRSAPSSAAACATRARGAGSPTPRGSSLRARPPRPAARAPAAAEPAVVAAAATRWITPLCSSPAWTGQMLSTTRVRGAHRGPAAGRRLRLRGSGGAPRQSQPKAPQPRPPQRPPPSPIPLLAAAPPRLRGRGAPVSGACGAAAAAGAAQRRFAGAQRAAVRRPLMSQIAERLTLRSAPPRPSLHAGCWERSARAAAARGAGAARPRRDVGPAWPADKSTHQRRPATTRTRAQVIVADDKPPGPFLDILRRLSHPHPLRMLRSDPLPPGTCLRAAAIAPWVGHGNSLLAVAAEEVGCRSVALTAAALWLRELFWDLLPSDDGAGGGAGGGGDGEEDEEGAPAPHAGERPAQRAGARTMQAVWLSRARHEAATRGRMTPWQLRRAAPNEPEVVLALQLAVMRCGAGRGGQRHPSRRTLCGRRLGGGAQPGARSHASSGPLTRGVSPARAARRWNNGSCPLHQAPGCHGSNVYFALQVRGQGGPAHARAWCMRVCTSPPSSAQTHRAFICTGHDPYPHTTPHTTHETPTLGALAAHAHTPPMPKGPRAWRPALQPGPGLHAIARARAGRRPRRGAGQYAADGAGARRGRGGVARHGGQLPLRCVHADRMQRELAACGTLRMLCMWGGAGREGRVHVQQLWELGGAASPPASTCTRDTRAPRRAAANLAAALGHKYLNLKSEGHLPAEDIAAAFSRAMDAAAEAHARPRRNHGRGGAGGLLRRWWGG